MEEDHRERNVLSGVMGELSEGEEERVCDVDKSGVYIPALGVSGTAGEKISHSELPRVKSNDDMGESGRASTLSDA